MSKTISLINNPEWEGYARTRSSQIFDVFEFRHSYNNLSSSIDLLCPNSSECQILHNKNPSLALQKPAPIKGQWTLHPDRYDEGVDALRKKYDYLSSIYIFLYSPLSREGDGVLKNCDHEIMNEKVFFRLNILKNDTQTSVRAFRVSRFKKTEGVVSSKERLQNAITNPLAILFDTFDGEILSLMELKRSDINEGADP
jgi:hypothetical protein